MKTRHESAQRLINAVYNLLNSTECAPESGEFTELIEAYDEYTENIPAKVLSPPRDVKVKFDDCACTTLDRPGTACSNHNTYVTPLEDLKRRGV